MRRPTASRYAAVLVSEVISVRGVSKRYGAVVAAENLQFDVRPGEFFGLLGPNGAGKTTTLEIIEGLRAADAGSVSVLGQSPWPRNQSLLPRIGVQLQASAFFDRLTVQEQIRTFGSLYGVAPAAADEWLERVGLSDRADIRTQKLSGGQLQRLSIACTLVHEPEIVFLDEPTAALDPQARRNLWDLLNTLNDHGRTVVLTTHYMDEAEALCDRVAIMDNGRILKLDTPAALIRGLDAGVRISVESSHIAPAVARSIAGVDSVEEDHTALVLSTHQPSQVLAELARRQALEGLQVKSATLEDVFLTLTGREYRA
jgi:ABC-2 type transport system ATP-binding protein